MENEQIMILREKSLSALEKIVLLSFQGLIGDEMVTTSEIADFLGEKEYSVGKAKRDLVKKGWLIEIQNNGRGKKYIPTILGDNKNGENGNGTSTGM